MAKIICASVDCKYYTADGCKSRRINLSDSHVHTVHQGFRHMWVCKNFEESEDAIAVKAYLEKVMKDANNHH